MSVQQKRLNKKVLNKPYTYLKLEKILCKYLNQINYITKTLKKQSIKIFLVKTKERRWREMLLIVVSINIHLKKQVKAKKA